MVKESCRADPSPDRTGGKVDRKGVSINTGIGTVMSVIVMSAHLGSLVEASPVP